MASVLVVCTGNVCRSPSAEGLLRRAFDVRLGAGAVEVSSAGTVGWDGSPATQESVQATAERGVDIASHRARVLNGEQIARADLIVAMAGEHREAVARLDPAAADRTFTIKELALLARGRSARDLPDLARVANGRRATIAPDPVYQDIADPLGMPLGTYRAMAAELDELSAVVAASLAPRVREEAS